MQDTVRRAAPVHLGASKLSPPTRRRMAALPYTTPLYWLTHSFGLDFQRLAWAGWKALCNAVAHHASVAAPTPHERRAAARKLLPEALQLPDFAIDGILEGKPQPLIGLQFRLDQWPALFFKNGEVRQTDYLAVMRGLCRERSKRAGFYDRILGDPARTARLALRLWAASLARDRVDSFEPAFWLSLLGASVPGLLFPKKCEFDLCYRRTIPWQYRCPEHSRHFRYVTQEAKQRSRIRTARRAAKVSPRVPGYVHDNQLAARQLSAVLWSAPPTSTTQWAAVIDAELRSAPLVTQRLGPTFDLSDQRLVLLALRTALDSLEWDPLAWPAKIRAAQAWFDAEQGLSPEARRQRRGGLYDRAEALKASGHTWNEIASALDIPAGTLKRTLRRRRTGL